MHQQSNFGFLDEHAPIFAELGAAAERAFAADPSTTLINLRQLGEALAQDLAARSGLDETTSEVRLLLDQHGYSEAKLKSAWQDQTNQEIAA